MSAERDALLVVRETIGDLRNGFSRSVEPSRWVEQLQSFIDEALAAGSRRAKTAKPVECEASQSGGCKPQRPNSTTPISIPQEPEQ